MTLTQRSLSLATLLSLAATPGCVVPAPDAGGDTEGADDGDESGETSGATSDPGPGADDAGSDDAPPPSDDAADETTGGSTGDPGDDDGDDDGAPAGCDPITHTCMDPAPAGGWAGPVGLTKTGVDNLDKPCEDGWTQVFDFPLFGGFSDGGESTCSCGCFPQDLECELQANLSYWDPPWGEQEDTACDGPPLGSLTVLAGVALGNPPWVDDPTAAWRLNWYDQELVGECQPASNAAIPEASFATRINVCDPPPEVGACAGDRQCVPNLPSSLSDDVCIFQAGEHECPDGQYTERKVYYSDIEDTRACATCECGEVSGSCTAPHFTPGYYGDDPSNISWSSHQIPLDGSCDLFALPVDHNALSVVAGDPAAGGAFVCGELPGSEDLLGEAHPTGAVTFCCAP